MLNIIIPMGTTDKITIEYIQKEMRKEFQHFMIKTLKNRNAQNEGQNKNL